MEVRKHILYGEDTCPFHQCQSLAGDVTDGGGLRVSKMGMLQDKGKLGRFHVYNVLARDCGSTHCCGCMVNDIPARQ